MIWPDTNSSSPLHCSHHFNGDRSEVCSGPLAYYKDSASPHATQWASQAKASIQTRMAKLIIHTRNQVFCVLPPVSFLQPPPPFPFLRLHFRPCSLSPHPLFLTTGHYELPTLAPGNYGNSFSLDYWRTVAERSPSGGSIIIIRCEHELERERAHSFSDDRIHSLNALSQVLAHTRAATYSADFQCSVILHHSTWHLSPLLPEHTQQALGYLVNTNEHPVM